MAVDRVGSSDPPHLFTLETNDREVMKTILLTFQPPRPSYFFRDLTTAQKRVLYLLEIIRPESNRNNDNINHSPLAYNSL